MGIAQSTINVCSGVRLNSRYEHSVFFEDRSAQLNFFAGKVVKTFSAYSFIRKSWDLNVAATMEEAASWSYLYFTNYPNGKRYFYFIDNIEYVNDGTVRLKLQIDVIQTYMFDFDFLPCFIERQHTTTDAIGDHTVDEGLELGELITNSTRNIDPGKLAIMVMCTTNPNATTEAAAVPALPYMYNRVFSGVKIWAVNPDKWVAWGQQLDKLDEIGQKDSIVAMWMYPMQLVKLGGEATWTDADIAAPVEGAISQNDALLAYSFEKNTAKLDGYTPRNKKLFTYPFNFAYCTDNAGTSAAYRFERFSSGMISFVLSGSLSPDGGVHLTPQSYNGKPLNYHEGLTLRGYPTCAWNSDIYKMWLAQNQHSNAYSYALSGLKIAGGIAAVAGTGGLGAVAGAGSIVSGAKEIIGNLAQRADRDLQPPQAKGNFSSSVNITNNMLAFT
ncbi:MAG: hypothetical protein IJ373_03545, partial [Clostridia bacterium]|nr:hypothetical protein [Clostridia bacterium]